MKKAGEQFLLLLLVQSFEQFVSQYLPVAEIIFDIIYIVLNLVHNFYAHLQYWLLFLYSKVMHHGPPDQYCATIH